MRIAEKKNVRYVGLVWGFMWIFLGYKASHLWGYSGSQQFQTWGVRKPLLKMGIPKSSKDSAFSGSRSLRTSWKFLQSPLNQF